MDELAQKAGPGLDERIRKNGAVKLTAPFFLMEKCGYFTSAVVCAMTVRASSTSAFWLSS